MVFLQSPLGCDRTEQAFKYKSFIDDSFGLGVLANVALDLVPLPLCHVLVDWTGPEGVDFG